MYTHTWIRAKYEELMEQKITKIQTGTQIVKKSKGLFPSRMVDVEEPVYEEKIELFGTGKYSDCRIDIADLANQITNTCNDYHKNGYDLIKIIDIIGGDYNFLYKPNNTRMDNACGGGGYAYGYGYSVTDGVVIFFKKREG